MVKKKKKTFGEKIFKKLFNIELSVIKKYLKQTSDYDLYTQGNSGEKKMDELNDTYIFDFHSGAYNNGSFAFSSSEVWESVDSASMDNGDEMPTDQAKKKPNKPIKIKVKPKEVLDQLETVPVPFDLILLDEKIGILKDKSNLIRPGSESERYARREVNGLIERLENRKKYNNFKSYFEKFDNTTEEKIDNLLEKYELVIKPSDVFIPDFPNDAIKTMTEYTTKMQEVCDKKPVFYVIAEESKFKKNYEKRDPILLVQSPFGYYWQILGAWNEEMLILHEL